MYGNPTQVCLGPDAEGWPCGAEALVHQVRYLYDSDGPKTGQRFIEVEYIIECPRCGQRTQTNRGSPP
jgi:hypothetical protein